MKRIFNHPPAPKTGKRYWRSLEEFADTPEFRAKLEREFPQGAAELEGNEVTRRGFMQFMGASVALAGLGLTGCRRPELYVVPMSKGVEWQVPGNALHYATSMARRGGAIPLIATSYDGRPTKLEGNPNVPGFNGSTDVLGQSAILDLYDPDRSKAVLKAKDRGKDYTDATFEDFWEEIAVLKHDYLKNGGQGLAVLTEPITSPTRARLRAEVQKQFPKLVWAEYDAWAHQSPVKLVYDFAKADVILSLDCDFLGASEGTVHSIAGFAAGRRRLGKTQETMARLYAVEGRFSLTGGMADHRLRVPSSNIASFATQLAAALGAGGAGSSFAVSSDSNINTWVTELAKDLQNAKGRSLIVCGSQQPAAVHAIVHEMNRVLGNDGSTVKVLQTKSVQVPTATISELTEQISQGAVKTLLVIGGNPAFDAPADLGFADVLGKVEQVIRLGLYVDETSAISTTHVPAAHFLESWGDSLSYEGLYLCQQPLIMPLYNGVSEIELLAELASLPKAKGAEHVQNTFFETSGLSTTVPAVPEADKQAGWHLFVHDGFLRPDNAVNGDTLNGNVNNFPQGSVPAVGKPLQPDEYELNFILGSVDDGRYANNGWLQEMPDPITKLTWDNALLVSPKTATKLGVNIANVNNNLADTPDTDFGPRTSDALEWGAIDPMTAYPMVEISTPDGRKMELPVLVAPGQHDQTLTIALGYGRTAPRITAATQFDKQVTPPLRVADGAGFNVYQLRDSTTPGFVAGVKVTKIDKKWPLAITQEHNSMEGRGLVREASLDKFHTDPTFVQEIGIDTDTPHGTAKGYQNYESAYVNPPLNSTKPQPGYPNGYQTDRPAWGMVIDLNTCVGCSACVIACQAENNIPIVGKFQVLRGREMHWIRNDRYFATDNPPTGRVRHAQEQRLSRRSADAHPADGLPAVRSRPMRAGLPRQRHRAQRRRPQCHGLQSLHRHPLLREQLPLQGTPFQFLQLQRPSDPEREAPRPRRD